MTPEPTTAATRTVRISADLVEALEELATYHGLSAAQYLDPLVRGFVAEEMKRNARGIRAMRKAREAARVQRNVDPPFANELGEAGA